MTTNRVEFLVAVEAISKLGAAAVLLSPAWKARRGRPRPRGHRGPPCRRRGGLRRPARPSTSAATPSSTSTTRRRPQPSTRCGATGSPTPDLAGGRRGRPRLQLRHHRAPQGRAPHPRFDRRRATAHWVAALGLGPDDRFQVATPPSHILGLLNLLAAVEAGATVRLHARFDLDEVLRRHRAGADDPGDGRRADRPGAGQPPRPRGPRPVVAALHHVGRHPRDRERGPDRDRAHRRPLAPRLRRQRAAGASPPTRSTTPTAWRLDSRRPPAGRRRAPGRRPRRRRTPSRPGRSARSRPAARR